MKRSIMHKAGTALLSTATGLCFLSAEAAFGQDANSSANEMQRRMADLYAREGKALPNPQTPFVPMAPAAPQPIHVAAPQPVFVPTCAMPYSNQQTAAQPQQPKPAALKAQKLQALGQAEAAPPVNPFPVFEHPFMDSNPSQGNSPEVIDIPGPPVLNPFKEPSAGTPVTTANAAEAESQSRPQFSPHPLSDPAPPVPAITPGRSVQTSHQESPATSATKGSLQNPFVRVVSVTQLSEAETQRQAPAMPAPVVVPNFAIPRSGYQASAESQRSTPVAATEGSVDNPFVQSASASPVDNETQAGPLAKRHPLADSTESSFEMPVSAQPATPAETPKGEAVLTPPLTTSAKNANAAGSEPFEAAPKLEAIVKKPAALGNPFANPPKREQNESLQKPQPASGAPQVAMPSIAAFRSGQIKHQTQEVKVGLDGCCPVTLRNARRLMQGNAEYVSGWNGTLYRLASAEAKQQFESHPELYAPVQAGSDVILTAYQGHAVTGSLEHAAWYRSRLYLFQNDGTLKAFTANPTKYVQNQ